MKLKELYPVLKYQMVTIWYWDEKDKTYHEGWYGSNEELESDTHWGDYEVTTIDTDDFDEWGLSIWVKEVSNG